MWTCPNPVKATGNTELEELKEEHVRIKDEKEAWNQEEMLQETHETGKEKLQ